MLFMVVEHFNQGSTLEIYRQVHERGRRLPDGLVYVDSWVEASLQRCFQLMECDEAVVLQEWVLQWSEFGTFEIVPVVPSRDTSEMVDRYLKPTIDLDE